MNQYSDFSRDTQTPKPQPGSYEWWYFDAISDNGYAIVIIYYEGNPFSRRYIEAHKYDDNESAKANKFPAISISVYKNDRPLFYSFEEVAPELARFSSVSPDVEIGSNSMKGEKRKGELIYSLILDQNLPNGDRLTGRLQFVSDPLSGFEQITSAAGIPDHSSESNHEWNLVQPIAHVTGRLEITGFHEEQFEFNGTGYHDHNLGREPMKDSFDEWYWGRYHFRDTTLIYYLMKESDAWIKKAWLIGLYNEIHEIPDITLNQYGKTIFGLKTARVIRFSDKNLKILLQKDRVLDSGPFYQRFEGRAILTTDTGIQQARGISEYIRPDRIYSRIFWPLVDMRIRYPGKAHWVQKSPVFYRWTW